MLFLTQENVRMLPKNEATKCLQFRMVDTAWAGQGLTKTTWSMAYQINAKMESEVPQQMMFIDFNNVKER